MSTPTTPSDRHIFKYMRVGGAGSEASASANLNNDFSAAASASATYAWVAPVSTETWFIERLIVNVQDSGTMSAAGYGSEGPLGTGIQVYLQNSAGALIQDLTDGSPVQSNGQWGAVCYDTNITNIGTGDEFLEVRWTFSKSGKPISLENGERLAIQLMDDMSGFVRQTFMVQGWKEPR